MHPQRTNILLQGLDRRALTVEGIAGAHNKLESSFGAILPVIDLNGQQKALRKSKPVNISQWRQ